MDNISRKVTRKQHWIPQFYLRGFSDSKGQLQVYRAQEDHLFATNIENVCAKRDLYEVEYTHCVSSDTNRHYAQNLVEQELSKTEKRIAPSYAQLLQCIQDGEPQGERFIRGRMAACSLAANLIVRHPEALRAEREKAPEIALELQAGKPFTQDELALLEMTDWREDYSALAELAIQTALLFSDDEQAPCARIYEALAKKAFSVFEAPIGMRFVATSMPLFFVGPDDDSYDFDIAYMPLSDTYAAVFANPGRFPAYGRLDIPGVMFLNRLLLLNCPYWNEAMTSAKGSLVRAIRDWKYSLNRA